MSIVPSVTEKRIEFSDNQRLIDLCGVCDENLNKIENSLGIHIIRQGNSLSLLGDPPEIEIGNQTLLHLYESVSHGRSINETELNQTIQMALSKDRTVKSNPKESRAEFNTGLEIRTRKKVVAPKSHAQHEYLDNLLSKKIVFGIGPAGTGKTYLSVAVAVASLSSKEVDRIVMARPAVEAGERLGFLPGDMKEKIDPYMQPLYDALHDFLPPGTIEKHIASRKIEIAPLAFMRGRTLSNAFIILDEAQNTTRMQMRMFLTRMGIGSRMAITGDITQIDLPKGQESGLVEARNILGRIKGIAFSELTARDVMRNRIVSEIIKAYNE